MQSHIVMYCFPKSIGSISTVFQNPFLAESFPASHSASDKMRLCNLARKSSSIFERYFTQKIECCTLFLNQSTRGCCKISSEAEIRRNQSVWRETVGSLLEPSPHKELTIQPAFLYSLIGFGKHGYHPIAICISMAPGSSSKRLRSINLMSDFRGFPQ